VSIIDIISDLIDDPCKLLTAFISIMIPSTFGILLMVFAYSSKQYNVPIIGDVLLFLIGLWDGLTNWIFVTFINLVVWVFVVLAIIAAFVKSIKR